jgi:Fe-S-cluster containining protein
MLDNYCKVSEEEANKYEFRSIPCPFLKDNKCINYEYRPKDCQSYPHLQKEDFVFRLWGVIDNYSICPIVFNVFEILKKELWNRNWRQSLEN